MTSSVCLDLNKVKLLIQNDDRSKVIEVQGLYKIKLEESVAKCTRHFNTVRTDEVAELLIPGDIPREFTDYRPVKTTGNGNCLFNAASIHLKGDESLANIIRLLSACELYLNANYYSHHVIIERAKQHPDIINTTHKTLFSILVSSSAAAESVTEINDFVKRVKFEAGNMCCPTAWSSMLQILSLPAVMKCSVYVVYPDANSATRPILNGYVDMFEPDINQLCVQQPFVVIWSRDGQFDARPGSLFEPNHFCAMVKPDIATTEQMKRKVTPVQQSNQMSSGKKIKGAQSIGKKQETLFSFFTKRDSVCEAEIKMAKSSDNTTVQDTPVTSKESKLIIYEENSSNEEVMESEPMDTDIQQSTVTVNHIETTILNPNCNSMCCLSEEPFQPQNKGILESSVRTYNNRERKCQVNWFNNFDWLTYCTTSGRVYCSLCRYADMNKLITFSTKTETAFLSSGFNNWKKAPASFRDHEISSTHREVSEKLKSIKKEVNVHKGMEKHETSLQSNRRMCLINQFRSLQFLLRQGLPLRGHTEGDGNFDELQELRAEDSVQLKEWIDDGKYQSPTIVNEQITMMGHYLLRNEIMKNVLDAKFYSILADETRDISNREQLSISLRWVSEDFEIYEDFIGMVQLSNTKSVTILQCIKDVLLRLCLPITNCRGQGYDGASSFMGHLNGVATRIQQEVPQAIPVHCFAHCLNLCLQDSCRQIKVMRDAIDLVREISSLINWSPKRQSLFEKIQAQFGQSSTSIKPLCPTRWTVRTGAISSVLGNYEALLDTMDEINTTGNDEYARRAGGVATLMQNFQTYFGLRLSHMLFAATEQLSNTLQKKDTCVQDAMAGSKMVLAFCDRQRDDKAFKYFYESVEENSKQLTELPTLPRYKRVPKRIDSGADSVQYQNVEDFYRQQYFEAIDMIRVQTERRFFHKHLAVVDEIEKLIIDAANGNAVSIPNSIRVLYENDIDMSKLEIQLPQIQDMFKSSSSHVKRITNIRTVIDIMNETPGSKKFLSAIAELIKLYLTVPVTTSTAERSFSSLRRLKTYLRSTMTQCRLNNTILLHCHKTLTDRIDVKSLAVEFASRNLERRVYFGEFTESE